MVEARPVEPGRLHCRRRLRYPCPRSPLSSVLNRAGQLFFEPVHLHFQPTNLPKQRLLIHLSVPRLPLAAIDEKLPQLFHRSLSHLHRKHVELGRHLIQRPFPPDRFQCHPCLELRSVLPSRRHHSSLRLRLRPNLNLLRGPDSEAR